MTGLYFFKPELLAEWNEPTLKYAPWVAVILAAALYVLFLVVSGTQGKRGLRRDGSGAVTSRG